MNMHWFYYFHQTADQFHRQGVETPKRWKGPVKVPAFHGTNDTVLDIVGCNFSGVGAQKYFK